MKRDDDSVELIIAADRTEIVKETRFITDMTTTAANTYVDVARAKFAVPAKQETARTGIMTTAILALVGAAVAWPTITGIATVAVIVIGGTVSASTILDKLRRKPE